MDVEKLRPQVENTVNSYLDAASEASEGDVDPGLVSASICALSWHSDPRRRIIAVERDVALATPIPSGRIKDLAGGEGSLCLYLDKPISREIACIFVSSWRDGRVLPFPEPWWSRDPDGASITESHGMVRSVTNYIREKDGGLGLRFIGLRLEDSMETIYESNHDPVQKFYFHLLAYAIKLL